MEEWKEYNVSDAPLVALTDLVEFIVDNRGKTVPTAAKGIKLIATNCIKNEYLYPLYEKVRYVSEDIYNSWFRSHPKPGDIVFVNKGTPGKCALVPDPVDFCIAQDMMAFRLKSDLVYNTYLLAILRSREIQSFIMNNQVGTIIPHFKKEQLKTLMIPLPEMHIQKRIGDLYFNFSEKTEINRRINENLEQQAQALFKSWFVDFEHFKDGEFVESELGMIPKGWSVVELQDVVTIKRGGSPRPIQAYLSSYGYHWLKISDATACQSPYIYEIKEFIKESGLSKTVKLDAGSLVLSNSATPGIPKILGIDSCIHDGWLYFPQSHLSKYYLYLLFKEKRDFLLSQGNGSVFTNLKTDIVKAMKIAIPNDQIMVKFNSIIESLFNQIENKTKESRRLAGLRDALLPKLMSGDLNINYKIES